MDMQKERIKLKNRKYYLKKNRLTKSITTNKQFINLPDIYKKLTLSEFMVYCAIRDCIEIHGQSEIVSNTCLSERSVRESCRNLERMGLISQRKVGKYNLLTIVRN